ncbi:hypothetical protein P8H26_02390 [Pseudochrobactrum sp. sp1633]|uniref:hypothetical protein n=1 Tax=Pseudochrobactrum sp. sp1633 TaxID=3036706 RepID=UPI0025A68112|nr:hypothetical protein [Pseudochrobactrum sp. sp1633]MDM8344236.1 hypothetical protein [Pseudochrobactrum sp. sp1633]HWD14631.1 hypothetical protein [Pseudochrobactrum sp.]
MITLTNLTARIFVIFLGYFLAVSAAVAFLGFANILFIDPPLGGNNFLGLLGIALISIFYSYITLPYTFLPALLIVALGEVFSRRDKLFYILSAITMNLILYAAYSDVGKQGDSIIAIFARILSCGFIGGLTYWMIAGRWTNIPSQRE